MKSRLTALVDGVRSSLFFIPMLCVVGGILLGEAMLLVDSLVTDIDPRFTATIDSARAVLTTVAGATIAFAGVAFSVSLLLISLASSQYSPRVVHGLFRDPFNKRVMGLVVGTFTYCLVILRAVRDSVGESSSEVVPSVSILLAVFLGIASILSIIAFINHAAHSMDVSKILRRVTTEALAQAEAAWPEPEAESGRRQEVKGVMPPLPAGAFAVRIEEHGWVQSVDYDMLLEALEPGTTARLDTFAGKYVIQHTPICHVFPRPEDPETLARAVRASVSVGPTRTLRQDVAYGVRQLADVALKAMSPGVNDPTTAHDAMSHTGTVLSDLLRRQPPAQQLGGTENRDLLIPYATTHRELVDLAFDELRLVCADQPTVLVYLLDVLHQVWQTLGDSTVLDTTDASEAIRRQADLILAMNEESDLPDADRERVRIAHASRFGNGTPTG